MPDISTDLLADARKGKRDAVIEILALHYPIIWRMAAGLTGREDVGRGVVRHIMQRSTRALRGWKDDGAPTRWFHHHTLLTTRRTLKHPPDLTNDTLLRAADPRAGPTAADSKPDTGYVAFVRALRSLPMQQREAFILHHGEKLQVRDVAVAMDCSTTAAVNHLHVANDTLKMIAPADFDAHVMRMSKSYDALAPYEDLALPNTRRQVRRMIMPWLVGRVIKTALSIAVLVFAVWWTWWVWRIVRHSIEVSAGE
jgi:DNA-directed RNA polymerase specialized sigma24 family protein